MFSLLNLYNNNELAIRIEYKKSQVVFDISKVVTKRNKDDLDPETQFMLLNAYLDYRGDSFKQELMKLFIEAEETLIAIINRKELNPLPYSIAHPIIDHMDYEEVLKFVKDVYKVVPPVGLPTEFDVNMERDNNGTRAQTYLKNDFLELAALITTLKPVLATIGQFAYIKNNLIYSSNKEYTLFNFIYTHPIYETAPMQKLYDFTKTLVEIAFKNEEVASVRIIEKGIAMSEMPLHVLAAVMFNRILISNVVTDVDGNNIITKMHVYISNKLNVRKDVTSAIRDKKALTGGDSEIDRDSMIESYRVISKISKGNEVELDWAVSSVDMIVKQMSVELDNEVIMDALEHNKIFLDRSATREQLSLLSFIFKDIIDPRGLVYVSNKSIYNMLSVGFAYLWKLDCKYMAILLNSISEEDTSGVMSINSSVNRSRITKELKDELAYYFPYTRVINATTSANVAEETINELANIIYDSKWSIVVGNKYTDTIVEDKSMLKMVPSDLKIQIADMLVKIERTRR